MCIGEKFRTRELDDREIRPLIEGSATRRVRPVRIVKLAEFVSRIVELTEFVSRIVELVEFPIGALRVQGFRSNLCAITGIIIKCVCNKWVYLQIAYLCSTWLEGGCLFRERTRAAAHVRYVKVVRGPKVREGVWLLIL